LDEFDLARAEQELEEYESVIDRATTALQAPSTNAQNEGAEPIDLMRRLYEWRRLRARALTKRAERLRSRGITDDEGLQKALDSLGQALKDLDGCALFISDRMNNKLDLHGLQKIRIKALMTRVEIDLDRGDLEAARAHLRSTKASLHKWELPASLIDRSKDLEPWYAYLRQLEKRLDEQTLRKAR
jgi:multidrug resistance efflux pump